MIECPLAATAANLPEYRYAPIQAISPELVATYGDDPVTYEVIDHLRQLVASLARGSIGFEYYSALSTYELSRVGW